MRCARIVPARVVIYTKIDFCLFWDNFRLLLVNNDGLKTRNYIGMAVLLYYVMYPTRFAGVFLARCEALALRMQITVVLQGRGLQDFSSDLRLVIWD